MEKMVSFIFFAFFTEFKLKFYLEPGQSAEIHNNTQEQSDVATYMDEFSKGSEERAKVKLIVLGNGQIGKTTLVSCLKHYNKSNILVIRKDERIEELMLLLQRFAPNQKKIEANISSTIGIEESTLDLKKGTVTVWDFAGQLEYTVTHQFFLSSKVILKLEILLFFNY